jgi:hypothetical protein
MRVLVAAIGGLLVALMLGEFFTTFMLPRSVRRDPRTARGLNWVLWRQWRVFALRLAPTSSDTLLGFFGPLALLVQLAVLALGLMVGFGLIEWSATSGSFSARFLTSSELFFSAGASSGSVGVHLLELLEIATGVCVLFIVIGYIPAFYSAFARREVAVSQLATRAGSPPAAGALVKRVAMRRNWQLLENDFQAWEKWAAELTETHLTYPLLALYRSHHIDQSWLAALTAMVDVAAFIKATVRDAHSDAADLTFGLGCQALSDLAFEFGLKPVAADRLSDSDFDCLFAMVDASMIDHVDRQTARQRLDECRSEYEPNAKALADSLVLPLPPWVPREAQVNETESREPCDAESSVAV